LGFVLIGMNLGQPISEIDVATLASYLAGNGGELQLIDVREPQEVDIAALDGFEGFPLSQFGAWSSQIHTHLDAQRQTIVLCHHGLRSAQMCRWLHQQGFTNVMNVAGGIDAYARLVDPTLPRY